jgi:choline/glycine/proline betaine transport protein
MAKATKGTASRRIVMNAPVFISSGAIVILFVAFAALWPEAAEQRFASIQAWVIGKAGWFYVLAVAGFLIFVVSVAVSDYGRIRLGPDHSRPDYSYRSWFAMLFSAGMGIGLMFFGVAEPVMHFTNPPVGDPGTAEAARQAMRITLFHWGIHAWAIYAVVGLSLAYFAYRQGLPLTIRSALYPLIGERIYGVAGHTVDTFAVLGTIFGVATSLGFGVMQVNAGLNHLFGVPVGIGVQMLLIAAITGLATISVGLGLDGGIRRVSELNMALAIILLVFVLVAGPTVFLLQTLVQNTGMYVSELFSMTFNLYAYEPSGWIGGWTLFYWGWWIAWSPFVGMFIARVSRGRTIREFVVGVLLVPLGFTFMWMTFFGDTAIHMVMIQGITSLSDAVAADTTVALFEFFSHLPLSSLTSMLATLLVVTFFVTSSDSGALVVDMLTTGGVEDSPTWQRIFWSVLMGVVAAVLLLAGGLSALQTASIASALPFTVVLVFVCWGLLRALRTDAAKRSSLQFARTHSAADGQTWQQRIRTLVHQPDRSEVDRFMEETARPALRQVAEELRGRGVQTAVVDGEDGRTALDVLHGQERDFRYVVRPRPYEPPSFVLGDTRARRAQELRYFRAEVHLGEGGQDYDVMGWSRDALIHDVLDQYERHLHFLAGQRG